MNFVTATGIPDEDVEIGVTRCLFEGQDRETFVLSIGHAFSLHLSRENGTRVIAALAAEMVKPPLVAPEPGPLTGTTDPEKAAAEVEAVARPWSAPTHLPLSAAPSNDEFPAF